MADRDAELAELYEREYDAEHGAQLIDGRTVTTSQLLADIRAQHNAAADRIMHEGLSRPAL